MRLVWILIPVLDNVLPLLCTCPLYFSLGLEACKLYLIVSLSSGFLLISADLRHWQEIERWEKWSDFSFLAVPPAMAASAGQWQPPLRVGYVIFQLPFNCSSLRIIAIVGTRYHWVTNFSLCVPLTHPITL